MEVYKVDSIVCGHYVFKEIYISFIGEDLECKRDVNLSSSSVSNETFIGRGND